MFLSSGADVLVESGAALVVQNNTATSQVGGGVYLQDDGSTFTAIGNSTRVTVESNSAGQRGGGMSLSFEARAAALLARRHPKVEFDPSAPLFAQMGEDAREATAERGEAGIAQVVDHLSQSINDFLDGD